MTTHSEQKKLDIATIATTDLPQSTSIIAIAREQINSRCIIPGSLGVWEDYFIQLCNAWEKLAPEIKPHHIIYGADNGIVKAGHIGYSADITKLMAQTMIAGGSAATRYARFNQIPYSVVDVGINSDKPIGINLKCQKGTDNFLEKPAMTEEAFNHVWLKASTYINTIINNGINLISFGEMGIGNTTTSAAVLSALMDVPVDATVGPGSGADEETLAKKKEIIRQGIALHHTAMFETNTADAITINDSSTIPNPKKVLQHVGGFDIVALTASMLACMKARTPFVIDGYITAVALVTASKIDKTVLAYAIPSHLSREPGMTLALKECEINPNNVVLHGQMALGEGTGSVLMTQLLKTTYHAFMTMTSFEDMMHMK